MKKDGGRKKKNNIFSQKNLLIGFVGILVLLFALTYFNPIFSGKNKNIDENSLTGELYQSLPGTTKKDDPALVKKIPCPEPTPGSNDPKTDLYCLSPCEKCVKDTSDPQILRYACVPNNDNLKPEQNRLCKLEDGRSGICAITERPKKVICTADKCIVNCPICQVCTIDEELSRISGKPRYHCENAGGKDNPNPDPGCPYRGDPKGGYCDYGICKPKNPPGSP